MEGLLQKKIAGLVILSAFLTGGAVWITMLLTANAIVGLILWLLLMLAMGAGGYAMTKKMDSSLANLACKMENMAENGRFSSISQLETVPELARFQTALMLLDRRVRETLSDTVQVLESMADNRLDVVVKAEYPGDFQRLKKAMQSALTNFSISLEKISRGADEITSATNYIATGMQNVSQGASEQSGQLHHMTAMAAKIHEEISKNAQAASKATEISIEAGGIMMRGGTRLDELMRAMNEINTTSQKIGNVIKTVDDIAFQTNILALNASVEAARAGSAGKGFAVVAAEVRNLANKSADASKGTAGLIQSAISSIENGVLIANETVQIFQDVMGKAKTATELTSGIAQAIDGQEQNMREMHEEMEQVAQVVQTNASAAEEGAAASEQLTSQAQVLKEMLNHFRLNRQPMLDG